MYGPDMSEILADLGIGLLVVVVLALLVFLPLLRFKGHLWASKNLWDIYSGKESEKKPKKKKKKKP